jgi:hypothetical protein
VSRDFLPRIFQADLHRLYTCVILPTLGSLPLYDDVKTGGIAASMHELLDNAEKSTSNLLAFEARRCFALTLAGVFERQLRIWVRSHVHEAEKAGVATRKFQPLLEEAGARHGLDLGTNKVGQAIEELYLLANAVRHGDGPSVGKLRAYAPHLWQYPTVVHATQSEEQAILSEGIQVADADFIRYMRAVTRFWGLADREFGAIIDGPY